MPNFTTDFSPFAVRIRPGRRREETSSKGGTMKNPSLTGQSSTSSTTSSDRFAVKFMNLDLSFVKIESFGGVIWKKV